MGLIPPGGPIDPACRRPLPPTVLRASSIRILRLLHDSAPPPAEKNALCRVLWASRKSSAWCADGPHDLTLASANYTDHRFDRSRGFTGSKLFGVPVLLVPDVLRAESSVATRRLPNAAVRCATAGLPCPGRVLQALAPQGYARLAASVTVQARSVDVVTSRDRAGATVASTICRTMKAATSGLLQ